MVMKKYQMESGKPLNTISKMMKDHYESAFSRHGPTIAGADWGKDAEAAILRYKNMLAVLGDDRVKKGHSLLDVGCGYGGLQNYAVRVGVDLKYTGVDIASNMIGWARENIRPADFIEGDFLNMDLSGKCFDYVVCNGILTQKLEASMLDMDRYAKALIGKMYSLCKKGIAFNMMSTSVNYMSPNLYYKHPAEILVYCLSEVGKKIKIDHSYGLYEFTVYIYK